MGRPPPLLVLLSALLLAPFSSWAFNVKDGSPRVFQGPPGSYFGLTVKLHRTSTGPRLVVGSPKVNTTFESSIVEPGGLFTCDLETSTPCEPFPLDRTGDTRGGANPNSYRDRKTGQWMGVSLDATQGTNGQVVTCGHRWINQLYTNHHLINGACYVMNADMQESSVKRLLPLVHQMQQLPVENGEATYGFAYGQAGISAALSPYGNSQLFIGAPGVYYWKGTVVHYEEAASSDPEVVPVVQLTPISYFSYAGYATAVGRLFRTESDYKEQVVISAPRADTSGLVMVLGLTTGFELKATVLSTQFGSYFGAALCVVDLNADGLDDLLVGAPLYKTGSSPGDHGRVFVYVSQDKGALVEDDSLYGSGKPWARFGQSIASAGKLLNQHYNSFVVGAPYEDNGKGAVYIYTGLSKTFDQRIGASPGMEGFGYGISGNLDVDGNGYPDISVGAYESDSAALFLARPVINVVTQAVFDKRSIDLGKTAYTGANGMHHPAIGLKIGITYTGVQVPESLELEYVVETDYTEKGIRTPRGRIASGGSLFSKLTNQTALRKDEETIFEYTIVFDRTTKDLTTPFNTKLSFKLIRETSYTVKGLVPMLNQTMSSELYSSVPFAKKCGKDERCDSDLQLHQTVETATGKGYLILGDKRPIDLCVTVKNAGEAAYQSVVVFEHPVNLRFRDLDQSVSCSGSSQPQSGRRVSCMPRTPLDGANYKLGLPISEIGLLSCEVGHPVHANQTVEFRVSFDARTISDYKKPLTIAVSANTTSNETNPGDNERTDRIPFVVSTKILLTASSKPDQLQFDDKASDTSKPASSANDSLISGGSKDASSKGVTFNHNYDIKNEGQGMIPRAFLELNVPYTTSAGKQITTESQVSVKTSGTSGVTRACELLQVELPSFPVSKPSRRTNNLVETDAEPVDIDCSSMTCRSYRCSIEALQSTDNAVITVAIRMDMDQMVTDRISHFFTEAKLTTNTTKTKDGDFEIGEVVPYIEYRLVSTSLYPRGLLPSRQKIQLWVILVAVFGGLFLLILLIVVLYKLGFFKRQRLDDSEKLVKENDDNETQEAKDEVDVKPPTAGGRDDVPEYGDNVSNNANHASYTAESRTGPMYGQLSMIDDEVSDDGTNLNNNNCDSQDKIVEDRDELGGVLVYTSLPYDHPPAPPIPDHPLPPDYDSNPLQWRPPPPPHHTTSSRDGYLLPVERRQL